MNINNIHLSGLAIAILGFTITQTIVSSTIAVEPLSRFVVGGIVPLSIGLLLSVFGVVLAVGPFSTVYALTVAKWTYIGAIAMLLLLVVSVFVSGIEQSVCEYRLLVSNVILGGAVGGAYIGDRIAVGNRREEIVEVQSELSTLINELLRHEILNAATIIGGMSSILNENSNSDQSATNAINDSIHRLERTVAAVGGVMTNTGNFSIRSLDLVSIVDEEITSYTANHPDVDLTMKAEADSLYTLGDSRIRLVITKAFEWIFRHGHADRAIVTLQTSQQYVTITVREVGNHVSAMTLEGNSETEHGGPSANFTEQIISLLTDFYDGSVIFNPATIQNESAWIQVTLPKSVPNKSVAAQQGLLLSNIVRVGVAGFLGGIVMGLVYQLLTGQMAVIGSLYGIESQVVGWITHMFHSIVFAMFFAVLLDRPKISQRFSGTVTIGMIGMIWGSLLWLVAAGIVMPLWLQVLGTPAQIPTLSFLGLVGHLLWGLTVGTVYAISRSFEYVNPF